MSKSQLKFQNALLNLNKRKTILILLLVFITFNLSYAQLLKTHLFPISIENKWGYINNKGELIIEAKYEIALPFNEGYALIQENGKLAFINTKDEKAFIPKDEYMVREKVNEDMLAYKSNYGAGFYSMKNKKYLPSKFLLVKDFSNGMAAFKDKYSGLYGFLDKKREIKILPQFTDCGNFNNEYCKVKFDGKWAFINKDGELNCLNNYTFVSDYAEDKAGVWKFSNSVDYIDSENQILFTHQIFEDANNLPEKFALHIYKFSDGLLKVIDYKSGLYGYKNDEGEIEIRYQFKEAGNFINGLACVKYGQKWGYINKKGEFSIQAQYDFAENFNHGLAVVYKGGNAEDFKNKKANVSMGYINKKGNLIWDFSH